MGELFDRLCQPETLKSAWLRVRRKNAAGGVDGIQPIDIEDSIDSELNSLSHDLIAQKYVPVPYSKGAMPKFNDQNEWRTLSLPSVKDKIVQQAFTEMIEPVFEKEFFDFSYAYRKNKGPVKAIKRVEHILRNHRINFAATSDIDNFFDTMNHQLLIEQLRSKIDEPEMISLATLWLHAGIISRKADWEQHDEGIAQGSVVSPLFSNIYLHLLDRFAHENRWHYIRYSDNFIFLSETKDAIYSAYQKAREFIESVLKLRLNENPYPFKDVSKGFIFLGIYFRGNERKISTSKETKIFRKINWLTEVSHQHDRELFLKKINESTDGTRRYYAQISPENQFKEFDQHLLKRLRFLLAAWKKRGEFENREAVLEFALRIHFYAERTPSGHKAMCVSLVNEVMHSIEAKPVAEKKDTGGIKDPAPAKSVIAQKNKYLRKVAEQTEIIVNTPGLFIGKQGARIVVREQRKNVAEVFFRAVRNISVYSNGVTLSSDVIHECIKQKIPITFYTFNGMPYAVVHSPLESMGSLSIAQIKTYESNKSLEVVKKILTGKSKNQMNLVKFYARHRKNNASCFFENASANLAKMETALKELQNIAFDPAYSVTRDRLFTSEARISGLYWDCIKGILPSELGFQKRNRHNAQDLVNCMLNYGYGILYQRVWQAVLKAGLNPHISFLHAFQANKPTLVYDLVEEYRQPFVDKPIFSILTRGKKGVGFKIDPKTGLLDQNTKDKVVKAVLARLSGLITFRGKKIKALDVIDVQVKSFAAFLEDKGSYLPFISGY